MSLLEVNFTSFFLFDPSMLPFESQKSTSRDGDSLTFCSVLVKRDGGVVVKIGQMRLFEELLVLGEALKTVGKVYKI
jgi:hypothetical protein